MPRGDNQPNKKIPDDAFLELLERHGAAETSRITGMTIRRVYARRNVLERQLGRKIIASGPNARNQTRFPRMDFPNWLTAEIDSGIVIIGSDAHYWPNIVTTAHKGFVKFCRELQPKFVIKNGDALDFASISRHAPIGWETRPSVESEIEAAKERMGEIEKAAPNAKRWWPLGNHDARFETRLATVAPEYARVHGVHLSDHFPYWRKCWALCINDSVVIKHRYHSGVHATHNNAVKSGRTMVTGHLHSLKVTPWTDYNGTRWGVDCGTMADVYGQQFDDYTEQGPRSWRSGFVVLTFHKGRLLQPQPALVIGDGEIDYCNKVYKV